MSKTSHTNFYCIPFNIVEMTAPFPLLLGTPSYSALVDHSQSQWVLNVKVPILTYRGQQCIIYWPAFIYSCGH